MSVNAEYSYTNESLVDVDLTKTVTLALGNELRDAGVSLRGEKATSDGKIARDYDIFMGTVSGVGDLDVGIDSIVLPDIDANAPEITLPARYTQARVLPQGIDAVITVQKDDKISYDLFNFSTGTPGGFGVVTVKIFRIKQGFGPNEINNLLTEIANAGAMVGFALVKRDQAADLIAYDLFVSYLPV